MLRRLFIILFRMQELFNMSIQKAGERGSRV